MTGSDMPGAAVLRETDAAIEALARELYETAIMRMPRPKRLPRAEPWALVGRQCQRFYRQLAATAIAHLSDGGTP